MLDEPPRNLSIRTPAWSSKLALFALLKCIAKPCVQRVTLAQARPIEVKWNVLILLGIVGCRNLSSRAVGNVLYGLPTELPVGIEITVDLTTTPNGPQLTMTADSNLNTKSSIPRPVPRRGKEVTTGMHVFFRRRLDHLRSKSCFSLTIGVSREPHRLWNDGLIDDAECTRCSQAMKHLATTEQIHGARGTIQPDLIFLPRAIRTVDACDGHFRKSRRGIDTCASC